MVIDLGLWHYATGSPAPGAASRCGDIGQEAELILAATADGGHQESCTARLHGREGLALGVGNGAGVVGHHHYLQGVAVGKLFAELCVVFEIDAVIACRIACPRIGERGDIPVVGIAEACVGACSHLLHGILHGRDVLSRAVGMEDHVQHVGFGCRFGKDDAVHLVAVDGAQHLLSLAINDDFCIRCIASCILSLHLSVVCQQVAPGESNCHDE